MLDYLNGSPIREDTISVSVDFCNLPYNLFTTAMIDKLAQILMKVRGPIVHLSISLSSNMGDDTTSNDTGNCDWVGVVLFVSVLSCIDAMDSTSAYVIH